MSPHLYEMPMGMTASRMKTTYDNLSRRTKREYDHRIDFTPTTAAAPIRGQICCAVPSTIQTVFFCDLYDAKIIESFTTGAKKIPDCKPEMMWYMFNVKATCVGGASFQALRRLLEHLALKYPTLKITWKEDEHGYHIDRWGTIQKKWRLDPF